MAFRRNRSLTLARGLSHWVMDRPTMPLSWLAANCGTSIQMLDQFYVKRLGLQLDDRAWL